MKHLAPQKNYLLILLTILALFCLSVTSTHSSAADIKPPKGLLILKPEPAPDFKLADTDGKFTTLSASRNKWVFVHFWASWCGPCRKELPAIQKLIEKMKGTSLKIIMINTAETEDMIFNFFGKLGLDMPTLMDSDGQVTEQWKPRGLPVTILVDPAGNKRYMALGGRPWDSKAYLEFLHKLLKSKP